MQRQCATTPESLDTQEVMTVDEVVWAASGVVLSGHTEAPKTSERLTADKLRNHWFPPGVDGLPY